MKVLRSTFLCLSAALLLVGGFAGCPGKSPSFTLEFPATDDLGELWLIEDANCFTCGSGEENLGRAKGKREITLPASHWYVSLRMPQKASRLMPLLEHPSLVNIGEIDLRNSDIRDEDLKYLSGFNLRSLSLQNTGITGMGLKYLKPNKKWTSIDLRNCGQLEAQNLVHFKGWKRSTISLVPRKSSAENYTAGEEKLLSDAKRLICSNQPENLCGTQIR